MSILTNSIQKLQLKGGDVNTPKPNTPKPNTPDTPKLNTPKIKKNTQFFYLKDPYSKKRLFFPSGKATRLLRKYAKHLTRYKYDKYYDKQLKFKRKDPIKKINQKKVKEMIRNGWNQSLMFLG